MKRLLLVSVATIAQFSWGGTLILTDGDVGTNVSITGTTVTTFAQATNIDTGGQGDEYAIAIPGTIRTLGNGNQGFGSPPEQYSGSEYLLNGTPTGVNYAYPFAAGALYDGATNGVNNFAVDYNSGNVYSFGLDWSNPVLLFTTRSSDLGITYDTVNQSLWISNYSGTDVRDYSLAGTLLSSFAATNSVFGLAMDYSDNTLWADGQGVLYQYDRLGNQLSTFNDGQTLNTLGAEFQFSGLATPEPGTAFLGLAGILAIALGHRKLRRS